MDKETHTIDASGKRLGRIATEAAHVLMGKHTVGFRKNVVSRTEVEIVNADKLHLPEAKQRGKEYRHYTGYPSGLRKKRMADVIKEKGYSEIVRRAVYGMLPSNKLRPLRMKKLTIKK